MTIASDSLIAIVGAGTMGAGIAQVAALAGHAVQVIDTNDAALARGAETLARGLDALVRRGRLDDAARAEASGRVRWSTDLADAAGAALLVEAVVERLDIKAALFADAAARLGAEVIMASNTSSLPIAALAAGLDRPERFVGLHFFNPVPAMKLVEVIAAPATRPETMAALVDLMRRWGKRPVEVRDVPGFIVNRVARPYYAEAFAALGEGVAPAAIDRALTGAGGFRMGPLALADMIGHDVNFAVAASIFDAYAGETRFRPQPAQRALAEGGRLGRKTGEGVYRYDAPVPDAPDEPAGPTPREVRVPAQAGPLAPFVAALEAGGMAVRRDPALAADSLAIDDVTVALGDGRPLAGRAAVDVLLDWARDLAMAPVLAFTARDDAAAAAFAGFAQAAGRATLRLPDRPGQLVLRTLAQLANAAADAVADAVAAPAGIDEAMTFGANHPEGPLAWARRAGFDRVADALGRIAEATGDPIYRPAAAFRSDPASLAC